MIYLLDHRLQKHKVRVCGFIREKCHQVYLTWVALYYCWHSSAWPSTGKLLNEATRINNNIAGSKKQLSLLRAPDTHTCSLIQAVSARNRSMCRSSSLNRERTARKRGAPWVCLWACDAVTTATQRGTSLRLHCCHQNAFDEAEVEQWHSSVKRANTKTPTKRNIDFLLG